MPAERTVHDVNEAARDVARAVAKTEAFARSRRDRKKAEMLCAHLKRILRLGRLLPPVLTSPKPISTLQKQFACARLSRPCLTASSSRLFCNVHHHRF
jgi:hypothetical protein